MTEEQKTQHDTPEAVVDTREAVEAIASTLEAEAQHFDRQSIIDAANNFAAMLRRLHQRATEAERERDEARFAPMGDNHHNAAACPYCNPVLKAALATARAEGLREAAAKCLTCRQHISKAQFAALMDANAAILALIEKEPK